MAMFRMITFDPSLTKLKNVGQFHLADFRYQTYRPTPVSLAPEFFPMMLVLLPTLIWSAVVLMAPLSITTFFAVPETAAVNCA
jgi:hypothetical protein